MLLSDNRIGVTRDSSGNQNILVGQHCTASLSGIPFGDTVSNYQWGVTGTTFQTWSADTPAVGNNPYNSDASYYVGGPGLSDQPTAGWYWNDRLAPQVETVSCTATVMPPAGQGSLFQVSVTSPVTVLRPIWTANGIGGYVKVNLYNPWDTHYEIFAGPTAAQVTNGLLGGMNITASVMPPPGTTFGTGSLVLAQLCTPNRSYSSPNGDYTYSQNGQEGSDGQYPYGWVVGSPNYATDDSPGARLADYLVSSYTMNDQFEDFLMYFPPSSTQCVPLAHFTWSENGTANLPTTGVWSSYIAQNGSDYAGSVTPSGNLATFLLSNDFPMWTQITGTGSYGVFSPVDDDTFRALALVAADHWHVLQTAQKGKCCHLREQHYEKANWGSNVKHTALRYRMCTKSTLSK